MKLINDNEIIIVDDSDDEIYLMSSYIESSRLTNKMISFKRGEDFLEYMEEVRTNQAPMPAIVFLDIRMPGMNGFDTLEELRKQKEFSKIPIVTFFSNSDNPQDKKKATALGAQFVEKPETRESAINFLNSLEK